MTSYYSVLFGVIAQGASIVKNVINLDERESRVINIVKAKYGLKDRSQVLSVIIKRYEECELEPQLT